MPPILRVAKKNSDEESLLPLFRTVALLSDGSIKVLSHPGEGFAIYNLNKQGEYKDHYVEYLYYDKDKDSVIFCRKEEVKNSKNLFELNSKEFKNSQWEAYIIATS